MLSNIIMSSRVHCLHTFEYILPMRICITLGIGRQREIMVGVNPFSFLEMSPKTQGRENRPLHTMMPIGMSWCSFCCLRHLNHHVTLTQKDSEVPKACSLKLQRGALGAADASASLSPHCPKSWNGIDHRSRTTFPTEEN